MADPIGMAVVGCGQIAEAHLKGIASVSAARLVCAVDVAEDRARSAAERHGAPCWTTSYEQALAAGEEPPVPGREVLKVMRTLDLVREASETGEARLF